MVSVFDLFKIGVGPSSSHTVGPMVAGNRFLDLLEEYLDKDSEGKFYQIDKIRIELFGSLAATGKGHATDTAILLGLLGHSPASIDTTKTSDYLNPIFDQQTLMLAGKHHIDFNYNCDLIWHYDAVLTYHPNALSITAVLTDHSHIRQTYYSVGGGFVLDGNEIYNQNDNQAASDDEVSLLPYPFNSAEELLQQCKEHQLSISQLVLANEQANRDLQTIENYLNDVWQVMQSCVKNGYADDGTLPGGLNVKRRAKSLYEQLSHEHKQAQQLNDSFVAMDWVNLYAIAVNEENANGGKVVTAPTNGAAGIIPAVLHYYRDFINDSDTQGIHRFLLTATAIGSIIKQNASISGAEVGCQGEVGSACAMAAAGLTEILNGTPAQCLNAAEIGIEHNLGLTCDPIEGLVQVPCIERNAMAAVKAINASRLARRGDGTHFVSLDKAIETMKETGEDMHDKYKETARGGLAIHANRIPTANLGVSVNFSQC
ncbi:L-serine ammonia-lyase [Psychrobacter sp. HD31]|uniref:L-serine ammonia-lyase n=1 Tax=Psychrobacter sp. HD31 TaxID=3112003 RepID=UPI003DA4846D